MSKKYDTLKDFLMENEGEVNPFLWAHHLYRHTFGPWVRYVVRDKPARQMSGTITITPDPGTWVCNSPQVPEDVRSFLNLQKGGVIHPYLFERGNFRTVQEWVEGVSRHGRELRKSFNLRIAHYDHRTLDVTYSGLVPPVLRDIYYDSEEARKVHPTDNYPEWVGRCVAIKVGSIVEGSDVEPEPRVFLFPFTQEEFYAGLDNLREEVNFYWNRDNTTRLCYCSEEGKDVEWCYFASWTTFEDKPETEDPNEERVKAVFAAHWDGETSVEFDGKAYTIAEVADDSTFCFR